MHVCFDLSIIRLELFVVTEELVKGRSAGGGRTWRLERERSMSMSVSVDTENIEETKNFHRI